MCSIQDVQDSSWYFIQPGTSIKWLLLTLNQNQRNQVNKTSVNSGSEVCLHSNIE